MTFRIKNLRFLSILLCVYLIHCETTVPEDLLNGISYTDQGNKIKKLTFNNMLEQLKQNNPKLYYAISMFRIENISSKSLKLLGEKMKNATPENIEKIIDEMDESDPEWCLVEDKQSLEFLKDNREKKRVVIMSILASAHRVVLKKDQTKNKDEEKMNQKEGTRLLNTTNSTHPYVLPPPDPPISWSPETDNWLIDIFTTPFDPDYQYNPRTPFTNQTEIDAWEATVAVAGQTILIDFNNNWQLYYHDWDYITNPDEYKWYEQCKDYQNDEYNWIKNGLFENRVCDHYGAWVTPSEFKCSCNHGEVLNAVWCCPVNWQCSHTFAYQGQCFPSIDFILTHPNATTGIEISGFTYYTNVDNINNHRSFFFFPNMQGNPTIVEYHRMFF